MKKSLQARLLAIPAVVLASIGTAQAELPAAASTEIASYRTDTLAALGLILAAGIAIWGLKKLGTKLGWI